MSYLAEALKVTEKEAEKIKSSIINNQGVKSGDGNSYLDVISNDVHIIAIQNSCKILNTDSVNRIKRSLKSVDEIENERAIAVLGDRGLLSKEVEVLVKLLSIVGVNAQLFTPHEALKVAEYAYNATDDIKTEKAETIRSMIYNSINGVNKRRDYVYDEGKNRRLLELLDKFDEYERGMVDISRSFDTSKYMNKNKLYGCEDLVSYDDIEYKIKRDTGIEINRDTYDSNSGIGGYDNDSYIYEELDDDELIMGGYVDERDVYCYGPYTYGDLEDIEMFTTTTWSEATDYRNKSRLERLIDDYIPNRTCSIESDLIRNYIVQEVVSSRRINARDLMMLASVFAIDYISNEPKGDEKIKNEIRRSIGLCGYYLALICGIEKRVLLDEYESTRPVSVVLFTNILEIVENWSVEKVKSVDKDYNTYLIKVDDHLFNAEALYAELTKGSDKSLLSLPFMG